MHPRNYTFREVIAMSSTPKFSFDTTVTPDLCGKEPVMNPTAAFTLFQNAAGLHAEEIGNGTAALAERNKYWVATHTSPHGRSGASPTPCAATVATTSKAVIS